MLNINHFRHISLLEGLSFLALLFVAMPAKYLFGFPEAVSVIGWAHGLLFMTYIFMASVLAARLGWTERYTLLVFAASIVPFACFFLNPSLRRQVEADA